MIVLDATTKSLEVVLASAKSSNDMAFAASWADNTTTTFTPGSSFASTNGTSVVTAVAAPAASTQRIVKAITISNSDTSGGTITVRVNANGTLYNLIKSDVSASDTLEYAESTGWHVISSTGFIKSR